MQLFIVEAKLNRGKHNPAMLQNLDEILRRVGFVLAEEAENIKDCLNNKGSWEDEKRCVELVMIARDRNQNSETNVDKGIGLYLTLKDNILPFIYRRFRQYYEPKKQHRQWP